MCEIYEHNHLILEAGSTKRLKGNAANNHRLGRHTWSIHRGPTFCLPQILFCCALKPHAKFQNPMITHSG